MPAPTVCTITGLMRDSSGNVLSGAIISATNLRPFIHPTDNSLIIDYQVSTTSAADGTWSLALVETTTPAVTVMVTLTYPTGVSNPITTHEYSILVPNQGSATFASLIGTQL